MKALLVYPAPYSARLRLGARVTMIIGAVDAKWIREEERLKSA